jgi:4-hydroxy-tetrahydrodipicolinate reductase
MVRVLLNGGAGKMGKAVTLLADQYENFDIVSIVDKKDGFPVIEDADPENIDVVIDISSPEGFRKILDWAVKNRKPFVSGTTGLEPHDLELAVSASDKIPVLHTSNLSRGVNILFDILEKTAPLAAGADVEIVETHHNRKKDAPSGTALELGRIITEGLISKKLRPVYGRSGITGERSKEEIGYHSIRCGDVPGEHTVIFAFEGERIEISHRALTRDIFARGAIEAAIFIAGKNPGKYSMKDISG